MPATPPDPKLEAPPLLGKTVVVVNAIGVEEG
jgi:hypothetical protein